jgi:hypothetical protein
MVRKPEPGEQRDQGDDAGGSDEEAESRNAILRRRALFVASAVAGLSLPSACADAPPNVCLSPPVPRTAQESAGTSASPPSTSAATSGSAASSPSAQPSALPSASAPPAPSADPTVVAPSTKTGTPPRACLRMASPPPTVCLMMAIPSDDKSKP